MLSFPIGPAAAKAGWPELAACVRVIRNSSADSGRGHSDVADDRRHVQQCRRSSGGVLL